VAACVASHRFRRGDPPASVEARILFDADKLDVTGAVGVARTLLYAGQTNQPLYRLDGGEPVTDGANVHAQSFFQEYNFKLKNLYGKFLTRRGREIAAERRAAAENFYGALLREVTEAARGGAARLRDALTTES
jgi:uncharacterized protein